MYKKSIYNQNKTSNIVHFTHDAKVSADKSSSSVV